MDNSKKKTVEPSEEGGKSAVSFDRKEIFDVLSSMLSELLDMKKESFSEDTMIFEELPLDSLQLYELVVDLEEKFSIRIPDEAIEKIQSVGDVVDMIANAEK